ncbi:hypothetical protein CSCA_3041 [Clostridium scatologenes]|uniref:Uncharacterized protein n=1 Tax=Clostridium scatologenes TaxID=1548 RepID=A0A0E3GRE2_CLOSL|nr:hypothetical protein CSCA_3041 [Clostridium scatologenes]
MEYKNKQQQIQYKIIRRVKVKTMEILRYREWSLWRKKR